MIFNILRADPVQIKGLLDGGRGFDSCHVHQKVKVIGGEA